MLTSIRQVGRVKDAEGKTIDGQYIAAGFTGHGMPRAYGWCVNILIAYHIESNIAMVVARRLWRV
jgi:hypothetical protein